MSMYMKLYFTTLHNHRDILKRGHKRGDDNRLLCTRTLS